MSNRIIALAFGMSVYSSYGMAEEPSFSLTTTPEQQTIRLNGTAVVKVSLLNKGQQDQKLVVDNAGRGHAEYDYAIRISDESGKTPERASQADTLGHETIPVFSKRRVMLKANESHEEELTLSSLYQLSAGHTYRVSLTWKENLSTPLRSNWVTVTVK